MSSFRRLISSRANARRSTGPKTEAGKRRSSQNALRHGARTNHTFILPNESQEDFDQLLQSHLHYFQPRNPAELAGIRQLAEADWRRRRLLTLLLDLPEDQLLDFPSLPRYLATQDQSFHRALNTLLNSRKVQK